MVVTFCLIKSFSALYFSFNAFDISIANIMDRDKMQYFHFLRIKKIRDEPANKIINISLIICIDVFDSV